MWLTKSGFATIRSSMTFEEMVGQIRFLARLADCLSVPAEAKIRLAAALDASFVGDSNSSVTA
jgi:hypothetical protein